jgi:hypothetical protein
MDKHQRSPLPSLLHSLRFSDQLILESPHIASIVRTLLKLSPIKYMTLFIYRYSADLVQAEIRREILDACRTLTWLSIFDMPAELEDLGVRTEWTHFVGDMVSHATQLRQCTITLPMHTIDLQHMSKLDNLTSLKIGEVTPALEHPFVLPAGSFARLESLGLDEYTTSASVTRSVLSFPPNGCLKRFVVKYYQPVNIDRIHDVRSLLGCHLTLSSISLESSLSDDDDDSVINERVEGLVECLPPLPHLTSLKIKPCKRTPINLVLIESILQLYPSLRSLYLEDSCPISLAQLLNCLGLHPLLRALPIHIRNDELPPLAAVIHPERLGFGPDLAVMSRADSPALRQVIMSLFPDVDTLYLVSGEPFWSTDKVIRLRV